MAAWWRSSLFHRDMVKASEGILLSFMQTPLCELTQYNNAQLHMLKPIFMPFSV